jgi:hypothetical protein
MGRLSAFKAESGPATLHTSDVGGNLNLAKNIFI